MKWLTLTGAALLAVMVFMAGNAEARPIPHPKGCHSRACDVRVWHKFQKKVVRRYAWFLGPTGACESGTDTNLRHGLRAINPTGSYRGRYQFGWDDWVGAGGTGDPARATWYEQGYRAVRWLHINGRSSWPNC